MLNRIKALCYINKVKRLSKATEKKKMPNKAYSLIHMGIFFFGTFVAFAVAALMQIKCIELIQGKETWAIALIALPTALFAIYIPVHIATINKYSAIILTGVSLNDIYRRKHRWFDLQITFWYRVALFFLLWIVALIMAGTEKQNEEVNIVRLIVYSLMMTVDLLYLILFDVWKHKQSAANLFVSACREDFETADREFDNNEKYLSIIKEMVEETKIELAVGLCYFESMLDDFLSLVTHLCGSTPTDDQKAIFITMFRGARKKKRISKTKESDYLIADTLLYFGAIVAKKAFEKKDYPFAVAIIDEMEKVYKWTEKMTFSKTNSVIALCNKTLSSKRNQSIDEHLAAHERKKALCVYQNALKNCTQNIRLALKAGEKIEDCLKSIPAECEELPELRLTLTHLHCNFSPKDYEGVMSSCEDFLEMLKKSA